MLRATGTIFVGMQVDVIVVEPSGASCVKPGVVSAARKVDEVPEVDVRLNDGTDLISFGVFENASGVGEEVETEKQVEGLGGVVVCVRGPIR